GGFDAGASCKRPASKRPATVRSCGATCLRPSADSSATLGRNGPRRLDYAHARDQQVPTDKRWKLGRRPQMALKDVLRRKSIETLMAEMAGEHSLARVLGPIALTSLGVGAIIGAGIFVMTGRVAAVDAGPAIVVSFAVAA